MNDDKITLLSSDSINFEVEKCIAFQSDLLKTMCNDLECEPRAIIPLPNVKSSVLSLVLEFCSNPCKQEFLTSIESLDLMDLILAANYLDIKSLLEAGTLEIADRISGKTSNQIREMLQLENDFTKEEQAAILQENSWALDS